MITGRPSYFTLSFDFSPSARFVVPHEQGLLRPYVAKFSPHELLLFALGGESGRISLVRGANAIDDSQPLYPIEYSFQAAENTIFDLTFLKSARNFMCAGSGDQLVHFIDCDSLKTVSSHEGHPGSVRCLTEATHGVLSGASDGSVCFWDRRLKDPVFSLQMKTPATVSAIIAPTSDIFITGDGHGRVTAWDFRNQKPLIQIPLPATETRVSVSYLCLSPDGSRMASLLTNNSLVVHRMDGTWRYTARQWANIGAFYVRCCFSPDSKYIVTGATNGALCIFEANRGKVPKLLLGHTGTATCVDWCGSSFDHILSCSDDRVVQLWGTEYERIEGAEVREEDELEEINYGEDVRPKQGVTSFYTLHHFFGNS